MVVEETATTTTIVKHLLGRRYMTEHNIPTAVNAQLYFAVLPEWVLYLPISAVAVRVYCVLRRHADNMTGECFPSRRTIAMKARCSVATLDRAIKELVEHKAVAYTKRKNATGDWTSNLYTVYSTPQGNTQVASKTILPSPKNEGTGSLKSVALTKAITNQKQEPRVYADQTDHDKSMGASLFHTGATLIQVTEAATDAHGNIRQAVIDTFIAMSNARKERNGK